MNALRMITRCARHQADEARYPRTTELRATMPTESAVQSSTPVFPEEDMGNGERDD